MKKYKILSILRSDFDKFNTAFIIFFDPLLLTTEGCFRKETLALSKSKSSAVAKTGKQNPRLQTCIEFKEKLVLSLRNIMLNKSQFTFSLAETIAKIAREFVETDPGQVTPQGKVTILEFSNIIKAAFKELAEPLVSNEMGVPDTGLFEYEKSKNKYEKIQNLKPESIKKLSLERKYLLNVLLQYFSFFDAEQEKHHPEANAKFLKGDALINTLTMVLSGAFPEQKMKSATPKAIRYAREKHEEEKAQVKEL